MRVEKVEVFVRLQHCPISRSAGLGSDGATEVIGDCRHMGM